MSALSSIGGVNPNSVAAAVGGGVGSGASVSQPTVIPEMVNLYNQSLDLNKQNYQNILNAYNTGQQRAAATLPDIYSGYNALQSKVADLLGYGGKAFGVLNPEMTQINQQAAQRQGKIQGQLISSGLSNSSILGNMANQSEYFRQLSLSDLGAKLANMYAGATQSIGQAGLGAQMQGLGMQNDLSKAMGQTLGAYRFYEPGPLVGQLSTSTHQLPNRGYAGGYGGGGGAVSGRGMGHIPFATDLPEDNRQTFSSMTYGAGGGGYNPYNPGPGMGRVSDYGSVQFPIGTPSGMGSNLGTQPIGNVIGGDIGKAYAMTGGGAGGGAWDYTGGEWGE